MRNAQPHKCRESFALTAFVSNGQHKAKNSIIRKFVLIKKHVPLVRFHEAIQGGQIVQILTRPQRTSNRYNPRARQQQLP